MPIVCLLVPKTRHKTNLPHTWGNSGPESEMKDRSHEIPRSGPKISPARGRQIGRRRKHIPQNIRHLVPDRRRLPLPSTLRLYPALKD